MPTRSSWSNNSSSTYLPSLRRASLRRQSVQSAQPDRCSGDFGGGSSDSIQFFLRIGKVGLSLPTTARRFTEVAGETLRWTWAAFGLAVMTGALLFTTNPVFYFGNFEFRTKMSLLLLAGINMAVFEFHTVRTVALWDVGRSPPAAARLAGTLSLVLWLGVIIFGRLIGFAAREDPFATM